MESKVNQILNIHVDVHPADLIRANCWWLYFNWPKSIFIWVINLGSVLIFVMALQSLFTVPDFTLIDFLKMITIPLIFLVGLPIGIMLNTKTKFSNLKEFQKRWILCLPEMGMVTI